jgi:hypothetical protein
MAEAPSTWDIDRALEERNFTYLSELIYRQDLTSDVRKHLSMVVKALLLKTVKYPPHRRKSMQTLFEAVKIGNRVHELKGQRMKKPYAVVAAEFKCSVRKVEQIYSAHKIALKHYGDEKNRHDYLMDMAYEAARDAAITHLKEKHGDREFTEEEVSDEMEAQERAWEGSDSY